MYYLTYRPRSIQELDNTQARIVLEHFLSSPETIPHAWLFVGHKGMGKTSSARILAKTLNPQQAKSIDAGTAADVHEINGADSTSIEDIRSIIDEIQFIPLEGAYRIYIIDEVHMLSKSAFNGLLKILEEPPSHAIFILATTEKEKIPPTIQSRCIVVEFGKATEDDIVHMLQRICAGENIDCDIELLKLISRHCDRSFRDAAKLLEELVRLKKLDPDVARVYIGAQHTAILMEYIYAKNKKKITEYLQQSELSQNAVYTLTESIIYTTHQTLVSYVRDSAPTPVPPPALMKMIKLLHEAYAGYRTSPRPVVLLHIALLEFCDL